MPGVIEVRLRMRSEKLGVFVTEHIPSYAQVAGFDVVGAVKSGKDAAPSKRGRIVNSVLTALVGKQPLTAKEIKNVTGCSPNQIHTALIGLRQRKRILRLSNGTYKLLKEANNGKV